MRLIVCGGRAYTDRKAIEQALIEIAGDETDVTLVHGDCRGADKTAADIAEKWGWNVEPHGPDLAQYGSPAAFHIRNQEMVDGGADWLVAFPGGNGTADCVRRGMKAQIPFLIAE